MGNGSWEDARALARRRVPGGVLRESDALTPRALTPSLRLARSHSRVGSWRRECSRRAARVLSAFVKQENASTALRRRRSLSWWAQRTFARSRVSASIGASEPLRQRRVASDRTQALALAAETVRAECQPARVPCSLAPPAKAPARIGGRPRRPGGLTPA